MTSKFYISRKNVYDQVACGLEFLTLALLAQNVKEYISILNIEYFAI